MRRGAHRGRWPVVLALVLAAALTTRSGWAEDGATGAGCSDRVLAWVARAAQQTSLSLRPVACPPKMVRLRLVPRDAPPVDVEVAEPPGPAFRRAGRLRVSPIVDVPDYGVLPAGQRRDFETLLSWLRDHESSVDFGAARATPLSVPTINSVQTLPWLLLLGLLLAVGGLWRRPGAARADVHIGVALVLVAAALRAAFGLWGPLHINGQGPLWIRGAVEPSALFSYGPGYPELFGWIARASAEPDLAVFGANLLLSAVAPALLFALGRGLGMSRLASLAAATLLVVDPVSIHFSTSEAYFVPIVTLVLATQWLLVLAEAAWRDRVRGQALLTATAAGLVAATAARIHPVAYLPLLLSPAVLLAAGEPQRWVRRVAAMAAATGVVGVVVALSSATTLIDVVAHSGATRDRWLGVVRPLHLVMLAAGAAGLWWARRWARPRGLLPMGVMLALAVLVTRDAYGQHPVWRLSYDRLYLPGLLLTLGAYVPTRLQHPGRLLPVVAGALAILCVWALPHLRRPTTEQLEYGFLRNQFLAAPAHCGVASVRRFGKRVLEIPDYLLAARARGAPDAAPPGGSPLPLRRLGIREPGDLVAASFAAPCLLYVRTSICSTPEVRGLCDAAEARIALEPLGTRTVPAVPSYVDLPYDRDPLTIGLYRLRSKPHPTQVPRARSCPFAITAQQARTLYDALRAAPTQTECRLESLQTEESRMTLGFVDGGGAHHEVLVVPRQCAGPDGTPLGAYVVTSQAEFRRDCAEQNQRLAQQLAGPVGADLAPAPAGDSSTGSSRSLGVAAFASAGAGLLLLLAIGWRRRWIPTLERPWLWALLATLGVALAVRWSVEPALANWYSEVAGVDHPGRGARFGPGTAVFHALLGTLLPWSDHTLFTANILLGALSVPLLLLALCALRVDVRAALAAGLLLAVCPLHVRISASTSAHVLSAFWCCLALALWVWGQRLGRWPLQVAALAMMPAACLTRADAWTQLAALPLWSLLGWWGKKDGAAPPLQRRFAAAAAWLLVWLLLGAAVWHWVVVPSRHPLPEWTGVSMTTRRLAAQYLAVALEPPGWVPLTSVLLAVVGIVHLALRQRGVLLCVLATLLAGFVPLGRNLETDGLLGARYFLLQLAAFAVLPGHGVLAVAELGRWWGRRWGCRPLAPGGVLSEPRLGAALALAAAVVVWLESRAAYAYQYAFQQEYRFLRRALGEVEPGCRVLQLPIRVDAFERDLDCCLDAPRSPLTIAFPRLELHSLQAGPDLAPVALHSAGDRCVLYYEGSSCSLQATGDAQPRHPVALRFYRTACAQIRAQAPLSQLAEAQVQPHATEPLLGLYPHSVRLYRVGDATRW